MTSNAPKFHLVMLLAGYSNKVANRFEVEFNHRERERSSDKVEIREINEWWKNELKKSSINDAYLIDLLPINQGIDVWIDEFDRLLIDPILKHYGVSLTSRRRARDKDRRSTI